MGIVAVRRLVFDMRRRNRNTALALLGRLVDLVERHRLAAPSVSDITFVIAAVSVVLP